MERAICDRGIVQRPARQDDGMMVLRVACDDLDLGMLRVEHSIESAESVLRASGRRRSQHLGAWNAEFGNL